MERKNIQRYSRRRVLAWIGGTALAIGAAGNAAFAKPSGAKKPVKGIRYGEGVYGAGTFGA